MKRVAAEPYRDIDFSRARRGAVIKLDPGKIKISIRLDNRVIEHFRGIVEKAGGGNYQTLMNDALVAYIQQAVCPRRGSQGCSRRDLGSQEEAGGNSA